MIIGIDIDDTITNHCEVWFDIYNKFYKNDKSTYLSLSDAYKWNFYDEYQDETKHNLFLALGDQIRYYENLSLLENVNTTIKEIIDSGNKVIFISATEKQYQEDKKRWLLEKIPMITENDIIFTSQKNIINVDVMIDDNLDYASKFNCPFILFKRPWNTGREQSLYTDNILICSNWYEIEKYLFSINVISPMVVDKETTFSDATLNLINGIKNSSSNEECIKILNPYISKWQKQGILIGIAQTSTFLNKLAEEVDLDIKRKDN